MAANLITLSRTSTQNIKLKLQRWVLFSKVGKCPIKGDISCL